MKSPSDVPLNPANFTPLEVSESPTVWESSNLSSATLFGCVDVCAVLEPVAREMFEPDRCLGEMLPPKRFHRTIWRSMTRRILAVSRTKMD
jgi:hypothetical protein